MIRAPLDLEAWDPPPDQLSVWDVAAFLLRFRKQLISAAVAGALLGIGTGFIAHRKWHSSASFLPSAHDDTSSRLAGLAGQLGLKVNTGSETESPQFYASLVKSQRILAQVASDTLAPAAAPGGRHQPLYAWRNPGESRAQALDKTERWLAAKVISAGVDRETGIVSLGARTADPSLSFNIANRVVGLVNDFDVAVRRSAGQKERAFIERRRNEGEDSLRLAQAELVRFLEQNRAITNSPLLGARQQVLQDRVELRQQILSSLHESYENARIREVRDLPVITVIDEPLIPVRPEGRGLALRGGLGLFAGFLVALLYCVMLYRVRYSDAQSDAKTQVIKLWRETMFSSRRRPEREKQLR